MYQDEIRSNGSVIGTMEYEIPAEFGEFTEGVITFDIDGESRTEKVILFHCDPRCPKVHVASRELLEEFFDLWNEQDAGSTNYDIEVIMASADVEALGLAGQYGYLASPANAEDVATARSVGVEPADYARHLIVENLVEIIHDIGGSLMGYSLQMSGLARRVSQLDPLYEPADEEQRADAGLLGALLGDLGGVVGIEMGVADFLAAIGAEDQAE